jgi:hypothetical protein
VRPLVGDNVGIWTPTTASTAAKAFYDAVEAYRSALYTYSSAGGGFLLTSQASNTTDISGMSPTLNTIRATLRNTASALQSAITAVAQSTANSKNTVWTTLVLAQANSVVGDLFMDSGLLYRTTVAASSVTIANSTRLTTKRFSDVANSTALNALTGMVIYDTVYETDTLQWYYYSGSAWASDGSAQNAVVATYNPIYRGIGVLSSASTASFTGATVNSSGTITTGSAIVPHTNDWMVNYSGSVALGIYYWSGSAWTVTTDYKYIADAAIDLCYLSVGGVTISGFTTFMTAIIKTLFVQTLTLLSGGTIASSNYVPSTSGFKLTGSTGTAEFVNAVISGTLGSSGILGGHIKILADTIYIFSGTSFENPASSDILLTLNTSLDTSSNLQFTKCIHTGVWDTGENSVIQMGEGLVQISMASGAYTSVISFDDQGNIIYTHPNDAHNTWVYGYPLVPASVVGSLNSAINCIGETYTITSTTAYLPSRGTWFVWGNSNGTSIAGFYAGNSSFTAGTGGIYAIRIA